MAEIKCQAAKGHIETLMYYDKHGKCPSTYVQQTQGQLWICERKWCDLIFYHPELPLITIRQEVDAEFSKSLNGAVLAVIAERDKTIEIIAKMGG